MGSLPADYTQLEMCTLLHNTTFWVTCACKHTLYKCIRVTQDAIHLKVQIDKYVQVLVPSAYCQGFGLIGCLVM